jgi:hypothetical protein
MYREKRHQRTAGVCRAAGEARGLARTIMSRAIATALS